MTFECYPGRADRAHFDVKTTTPGARRQLLKSQYNVVDVIFGGVGGLPDAKPASEAC